MKIMVQAAFKKSEYFTTTGGEEFALNLSGATISDASFSGNVLAFADFSGATLTNFDFSNADLTHANFSNAVIEGTSFAGANLSEATFLSAKLKKVVFSGSKLKNTIFCNTGFRDVDFKGADLREVLDITPSSLYGYGIFDNLGNKFDDGTIVSDEFSEVCKKYIQRMNDAQENAQNSLSIE